MISKTIIPILFFTVLNASFSIGESFGMPASPADKKYMTEDEYQNALAKQNQIHAFIRVAGKYEKEGRHREALENYMRAYEIDQCAGLVAVCRGAMADNYEALGEYQKALDHIDWFLSGLNTNEPLFSMMTQTKKRLLQKIEAQKRGEGIEEPVSAIEKSQPVKRASDFYKADYGSQKKFLEEKLPEDTDILRLSKQAMLAEHAGDFRKARECYEKLLAQKGGVIAAQGEVAWVMLHAAVQRTSEVTGDEAREKEMLVWIRDQMIAEQGPCRKYLSGLMPPVQAHIKERLKKFGLGSKKNDINPSL
jgi:hypothetical protein